MNRRYWLSVRELLVRDFADTDWFDELAPIPDELAARDRIVVVAWPDRGPIRRPVLAATGSVTSIDRSARRLRLRRRVTAIAGHEISLTTYGAGLAATGGWTSARRSELMSVLHLIDDRDFQRIEHALLEAAHHFGPPPKRHQHSQPRTPGRRALIAGRASVSGSRRGVR